MIYVYSDIEGKREKFFINISKNEPIRFVDGDFLKLESDDINQDDILLVDVDLFSNIEEVVLNFNTTVKKLKVVAVTSEPKLAYGAFLIKKGFRSYLGKETDETIVKEALNVVKGGNIWLYPQLLNYIIKHISVENTTEVSSTALDKLTPKEQNVANLVASGLSNKEIASKLDVQLVTVKKHISSIFAKLDVKDRLSLAMLINS